MANLTLTASNQALAFLLGQSATAPTGTMKVALVTANGTAAAAGTEVVGGSYARQDLSTSAPVAGASSNAADLVFEAMPACTVVGVEIWDSAGTPIRWAFGPIASSRTVEAADDLRILAGELDISLS